MTEAELKQLFYLNRESERLQEELRLLEAELQQFDSCKGVRLSHGPKSRHFDPYDKLTSLLDSKRRLMASISRNLGRIQRQRAKLEQYITTIEDAQIRLIFRLRHIDCLTWEEIGMIVHMDRRTVSRKHFEYLKVARNAR